MKTQKFPYIIFGILLLMLSGCSFIGSIFKTGVGVGVFIVVALLIIIFLITRLGRKNKV
jgi:hypothetical protein